MRTIELADAEGRLGEIVGHVERGEDVELLRDGRSVARVTAVASRPDRRPFDFAGLRAATSKMTWQQEGAGDFVRRMRDDTRY